MVNKKDKCATAGCSNKRRSDRRICSKCQSRRQREADPMRAAYHNLLTNAKRRRIFCDLSYDQFKEFCIRTDYIAGKGRTKESYTVDRINESLGYTAGNLQLLTNSDNSKKEQARRKKILVYDYRTQYATVI